MASLSAREIPFYVGTNSAPGKQTGILRCALDSETGKISAPVVAADAKSPSFLAASANGRFLYASIEQEDGGVASFQIRADHSLVPLNSKPAGGKGTCHVWVDKTHVFASNYSGGNVACLPILPDGSLGDAVANIAFSGSGPDPVRQKKPFAHGAVMINMGKTYVFKRQGPQALHGILNRERTFLHLMKKFFNIFFVHGVSFMFLPTA